jgi:hypothetical protein
MIIWILVGWASENKNSEHAFHLEGFGAHPPDTKGQCQVEDGGIKRNDGYSEGSYSIQVKILIRSGIENMK